MPDVSPLDLFRTIVRLRASGDQRPCIVLSEPRNGRVLLAPLSSALDLYSPTLHFLIRDDHPDFKATGLTKTSYVIGNELRDSPVELLGDHLGRFEGELAGEFKKWIG